MKKRTSLILILILSLFTSTTGQQKPAPAPQKQQTGDDEVVRITTNLVQIDAVVTDKNGKLVTDLRPEEVEILEDDRPQKITNFSYVSTESGTAQPVTVKPATPVDKLAPPVPPVRLKPEQVRRTIALVVDDLGLSFESTHYVREALKKFVDRQMQPGDLVAIIRTGGGIGALQQFTSDKRQLYAAIERISFNLTGRGVVGAFGPVSSPSSSALDQNATGIVNGDDADQFREEIFTVGTLGAINYVVRGMRELPGRKSILLMSDGISSSYEDPARRSRVINATQRLIDLATRASVTIYTMDARGLPTLPLEDVNWGPDPNKSVMGLLRQRASFNISQDGLKELAKQTGGFFIGNENDLSGGIKRVLDDQKGYYLIGYRPDESTFDQATGRRKFHKISIKVNRPGLQVRSRTGFYGITNEQAVPQRHTRAEQLLGALTSPFSEGGVRLRLTSLFGNDPNTGSFVRSLLHIDARDLTFTDEADGWHKAVFDVLAVTFGDNGMVVDQADRIQTVRVRGETYKRVLENGFVYNMTVPIKKPGAYQLRTALRDISSEHVGSASQFIEIPNIGKKRLALSGIAVIGTDPAAKTGTMKKTPVSTAAVASEAKSGEEEELADTDPKASPAVRKFRRGMMMNFGYVIYNAQVSKAVGRPQLQTQMRLFRDGQEIFAGQVQPLDTSGQLDLRQLSVGGALQLGTDMTLGEYILQVIVTDPLAKPKYRTTTQWIDFEIVK